MHLQLPATIGKYELSALIGKGATGKVYRARDTFTGNTVAFKLVDQAVLQDPEFDQECRRQFLNEASLAGRLNHPHIVSIMEAAVSDPGYVVMEYIAGGNLTRHTQKDSLLPVEDALQVLFKCCGALDYAFREGIIHRDIKPANVMVSEGTEVKIADFGAALFYRAQATQVVSVGTPYYLCPEQIRGEQLSHLSDMYSLGILGYELFTGQRPFDAASLPALFSAIAQVDPLPPSKLREGLPKGLDALILRMIAKDPADRYASWAELALEMAELGRFSQLRKQVPDSEKFRRLRLLPDLAALTDPEIWELVRACAWAAVAARAPLIKEGDTSVGSMYLLASGEAKVTRAGRLLNVMKTGEWFGEMAYLQKREQRQTTVETMSDALVAELPLDGLATLSRGLELKLCRMMLRTLADRLSLADARIMQAR
jgi:eukaryotic-like serine/threonine-protein kinase